MLERTSEINSRGRSTASSGLALAVVALDVLLVVDRRVSHWLAPEWFFALTEPLLALVGVAALLCINDGDSSLLGMRGVPTQGWLYWVRVACWLGAAIGLLLGVCSGIWLLAGWNIPAPPRPGDAPMGLFWMCFYAPLVEEIIFRSLLTAAVLPLAGQRGAIVASGIIFAAIHVINGNPALDNQVAGFLLEWAFLRSGTILVPIAMHAAGNLIAFALHVAVWNWL